MSLINEQAIYFRHKCQLGLFAEQYFTVTEGEAERTQEQHELNVAAGRSTAKRSRHQDKCATDLHFFIFNGKKFIETTDPELYPGLKGETYREAVRKTMKIVGDYWKSLDPKNRWGGDWSKPFDPWHFERAA